MDEIKQNNVGASILNIITESLYDKPIVVFREYVQNSVDSFNKSSCNNKSDFFVDFWFDEKNLYFLDNGDGIDKLNFEKEMISIAHSKKDRIKDVGYKGIGRLSGLSYCNELWFANIYDYRNKDLELYCISYSEFKKIKNEEEYNNLSFSELMNRIGRIGSLEKLEKVKEILKKKDNMFVSRNRGFFVVLNEVNTVLRQTIKDNENFTDELGWLLPVDFKEELYKSRDQELFIELSNDSDEEINHVVPAKNYNISFNGIKLERPIEEKMLREYTLKRYFEYGKGFFSFYMDGIVIEKGNKFTGIKIYIDNILLCDENELIPMLKQYGYINNTVNELIQTVKGIGAIIYITDKVNISANARRTFIEVTNEDSINFMKILSNFIEEIYDLRYSLSKYKSERNKQEHNQEKLDSLRTKVNEALKRLSDEKVRSFTEDDDIEIEFKDLDELEKKKQVKKYITKNLNAKTNEYLVDKVVFNNFSNVCVAYADFIKWLKRKI